MTPQFYIPSFVSVPLWAVRQENCKSSKISLKIRETQRSGGGARIQRIPTRFIPVFCLNFTVTDCSNGSLRLDRVRFRHKTLTVFTLSSLEENVITYLISVKIKANLTNVHRWINENHHFHSNKHHQKNWQLSSIRMPLSHVSWSLRHLKYDCRRQTFLIRLCRYAKIERKRGNTSGRAEYLINLLNGSIRFLPNSQ